MASERTFTLVSPHLTGEDIRQFQRDLSGRFKAWDINIRIADDGDYGSATRDAGQQVCKGLGILHEVAMNDGVTPALRIKIRHPDTRTPQEIARSDSPDAKDFRAKLRERFQHATGKTLTGIDVSNLQRTVDWTKVKAAGHSFAVHKVSEGLGTPDREFRGRWKAMHDAGLVRGAYHFARPQKGRDPKAEVHEFLGLVKQAGGLQDGDLRPVLDIEDFGAAGALTAAQTQDWVRRFVDEMRARIGVRPIIYTGAFWRGPMGNPPEHFGCRLWLAAFVKDDPEQFVPRAWAQESFSIWQHTEHGRCAGVAGDVDLNRLPGGEAALNRLRV
jgi:GH25 family lysozyme M1 (1,4-beta-N-acetylmuramidase)